MSMVLVVFASVCVFTRLSKCVCFCPSACVSGCAFVCLGVSERMWVWVPECLRFVGVSLPVRTCVHACMRLRVCRVRASAHARMLAHPRPSTPPLPPNRSPSCNHQPNTRILLLRDARLRERAACVHHADAWQLRGAVGGGGGERADEGQRGRDAAPSRDQHDRLGLKKTARKKTYRRF
eukprot:6199911-Pleurochrysis_carterae.AAC.1